MVIGNQKQARSAKNRCRVLAPPSVHPFSVEYPIMTGLTHVRKEKSKSPAINIVSAGVTAETLERLEKRCAEMNVPRGLVIRDFINFCLDICDRGDIIEEIHAALKKKKESA
jgi:hypothetical protein